VKTDAEARNNAGGADAHREVLVKCPATGEVVGAVPVATAVEVEAVAARLRGMQPGWQQLGVQGRAQWIGKWRDWLSDHSDELLDLVQLEGGRSWGDTASEILLGMLVINYWIDNAADFLADESVRPVGAMNASACRGDHPMERPVGGAAVGYPRGIAGGVRRAVQALGVRAAGVASRGRRMEGDRRPRSTRSSPWFRRNRLRVSRSRGLCDVHRICQHRAPHRIGGGTAPDPVQPRTWGQGRDDRLCRRRHRPAVDGAVFGGFALSGQACISVERVYVEEPVYDEFVRKLVAKTSELRQGMDTGHDYSCDVGSMVTEQQLAIVCRHVDDAVSKGAKVLTGGKPNDNGGRGLFYEPTVLVDVDHEMDCMREETFGPTLPVMKVRDAAEAIEKANDSRFGLSSSVWTRDKTKAMALARQMSTGTVNINNVLMGIFQFPVPMGGWKESGVGSRSGGAEGIRKYCRPKALWPNGLS
jgi:acyl-CoA reductase-like NAD-dependent aldehyde dehydrogenase